MDRNMTRRTAMTALAGSLAALRIPAARAAGEPLRVGKAVVENVGYIPLDVGMEYGIFEKHGLTIEELNFAGGAKIAQAMTAGAVDISLSAGPDMQFVAKGAPEIAIGSIAEFAGYMGFVVAANSKIHSMDDLRGKTVGITSPASPIRPCAASSPGPPHAPRPRDTRVRGNVRGRRYRVSVH